MRILFIIVIGVIVSYLVLEVISNKQITTLPPFLLKDQIAEKHKTNIKLTSDAAISPTPYQLEILKNDYKNIWAHLNHLYQTNDVIAGKEYYTEAWFRQLTHQFENKTINPILRNDLHHELHLQNWSTDALVCTAIDSNLVFQYTLPDKKIKYTKAKLAIVLLFQGDHWRIDAIRIIEEIPFPNGGNYR